MNALKKIVLATLSIGALYFCVGYLTAWQSKQACIDQSYQSARQRDVRGRDMRGRAVRPKLDEFHADISGPFMVEVNYSVPRDLHATILIDRYLTLPWRRELRSSEKIHLVAVPDGRRREGALAYTSSDRATRGDGT